MTQTINGNAASEPISFTMNGGNGTYSYMKNSSNQREGSIIAKTMIDEAIAEKLEVEKHFSKGTFRIADMGCSVGPNTFIAMQNVIEAVEQKYESKGLKSQVPEFQVFFNDHTTNDFNTLFTSLSPKREYFAAGVPGSFHGRLFPESSLNIVHASYALQWLSKVPEEVQNKNSVAWNKGQIYYTSASDEVVSAYQAQFASDMDNFLNYRTQEIVVGGMLLLVMICIPDGIHYSQLGAGVVYDAIGSCLMDMANEGLISEEEVDSFNLPVYAASPKETIELVERNGCFSIEKKMLRYPLLTVENALNMKMCTMHTRAAIEGVLTKHFGSEIIDELFSRFQHKMEGYNLVDSSYKDNGILLLLALKRK